MIDNPEYKGEWKQKTIDNPDYKGVWSPPDIDNPEYVPDDKLYLHKDLAHVGFELWQVKAGTVFDNIFVGDSLEEAEAFRKETFEHGARLHLPELEANVCEVLVEVQLVVRDVLRVVDVGRAPHALVVRVVDRLLLPLALVLRVVDHGRLPLAVVLLVPVLGLLRLRVGDLRGDVVPPFGLGVRLVRDRGALVPVLRLLRVGVRDGLRLEERPVVLEVAGRLLLAVDEDGVRVVRLDVHRVDVRELVRGARHVHLLEEVLAVVREDGVHAL